MAVVTVSNMSLMTYSFLPVYSFIANVQNLSYAAVKYCMRGWNGSAFVYWISYSQYYIPAGVSNPVIIAKI